MRRTLGVLGGALAGLLAACSLIPGRSAAPAPIRVSVDAAARLNPDEQGESLPTAVRVYQLTAAAKASGLDLIDLVRDPKAALGPDLLAVDEMLVEPGRRAEKTFARDKGTRAVVVAALVRRPAGTSWREIVELPSPGRAADLAFVLREYRLERR
jgi:type VI secretion system protein VasD